MTVEDLPAYFRREAACYRVAELCRTARQRQYTKNRNAQLRRREGKGAC